MKKLVLLMVLLAGFCGCTTNVERQSQESIRLFQGYDDIADPRSTPPAVAKTAVQEGAQGGAAKDPLAVEE